MTKIYTDIPLFKPKTPLLDQVGLPVDLRKLDKGELSLLADELREFLLYSVGRTGGHFGAGLGVIELTIALHYIFNTPYDRLVWDVGHQTYPHKILTGRREQMHTIRRQGGLSGFPNRQESEYDTFGVGHSSTSVSAALGMALASRAKGESRKHVAVIGDGAMTAGMAFEALNHTAHVDADLLVVLNDNNMSISHNVGGLSTYFSKVWSSRFYNSIREGGKKVLKSSPSAKTFVRKTEEHLKAMVAPGIVFEELGFNYIGPIDGHDIDLLVQTLGNLRELDGPILLHVLTQKGKGFSPAEKDPVGYHALNKIEPAGKSEPTLVETTTAVTPPKPPKYQDVFGQWLCDMAGLEPRLFAITPAMTEGSGMVEFSKKFPDQFQDVAIAEQHAVTLAAGLACEGLKPVVAIYSTFLQRAYDQLIHDVAIQNLDVLFAMDRAGLVGEDGATHAGSYDLSYLRCIPNLAVMTPSDENETRQMLFTGFLHNGPAAVRYPRGTGTGVAIDKELQAIPFGKGREIRKGTQIAILNFGTLLSSARIVAEKLNATLVDMRFVKPLDTQLIEQLAKSHTLLVTLEENAVMGGAGSAVAECLSELGYIKPLLQLGLPDRFVEHASHEQQLAAVGLDAEGILDSISKRIQSLSPLSSVAL